MPFSSSPKLPAIDTFCVLLAGGQGTWLHEAAPFAGGSKLGDLPRGGTALVATAVLERYREEHPPPSSDLCPAIPVGGQLVTRPARQPAVPSVQPNWR